MSRSHLTLNEAARELRGKPNAMSRSRLNDLCLAGRIRGAFQVGRQWNIPASEIPRIRRSKAIYRRNPAESPA